VNAGFRLQRERLAHFVEARTDTRLAKAILDEEEKLALFGGQHKAPDVERTGNV
jgi:hypothetical protein